MRLFESDWYSVRQPGQVSVANCTKLKSIDAQDFEQTTSDTCSGLADDGTPQRRHRPIAAARVCELDSKRYADAPLSPLSGTRQAGRPAACISGRLRA